MIRIGYTMAVIKQVTILFMSMILLRSSNSVWVISIDNIIVMRI